MITTQQLAKELNISQRAIQNRILRLGLKVEKAGIAFVLTKAQADQVRRYIGTTAANKPILKSST